MNQEQWIDMLNLEPHPEGGYYKEIIKSSHTLMTKMRCIRVYIFIRKR